MPRCLAFTGTFPMTIKIDLANQVRQTILPRWKPLLPLFEAVMKSFQAIKDAELPANISGQVTIEVERERTLFAAETPLIVGFIVHDNGIGLDDRHFASFNTAFSIGRASCRGRVFPLVSISGAPVTLKKK